jgi:hypothetical protein
VGDMLENSPTTIDPGHMRLPAEWAEKTAMVWDSINDRKNGREFLHLCKALPIV